MLSSVCEKGKGKVLKQSKYPKRTTTHDECESGVRNSETLMRSDLYSAAAELLTQSESGVHRALQVPLQPATKVPKHGGASRQDNVLMHTNAHTILIYLCFHYVHPLKKTYNSGI